MSLTNFKTENSSLRKLFGNGLYYQIPRFQRDYSWEEEQWEDLWHDLEELQEDQDSSHYMGYLVLQSDDDRFFYVIDGQQRLTTSAIIILAVLKNLQRLVNDHIDADSNQRRMDQIRQNYIGYLDPVSLVSKSKLTLNKNNDDYFQRYIVPLDNLPQRGFRASEHLLRKAFEWFDEKILSTFKTCAELSRGQALAKFVEDFSDKLFFTVITVTDELNAYKVFETLNARGVRLSSTDLLKNYLFSVLDKGQRNADVHQTTSDDIAALEQRWETMVGRLQGEKFPEFLRIYWNSYNKLSRQHELFKTIRNNIKSREEVFVLVKGMEADLDNYMCLISPGSSNWSCEDRRNAEILKMFRVRQPYSLLLAVKRKFKEKEFSSLLRAVVVISFRYSAIGGYSPAEVVRVYNSAAEKISRGEISELADIWAILKRIYVPDKKFKDDFSEKTMNTVDSRTKKIVRYILCSLEKHLSGVDCDYESDSLNIEHILPQNAPDNWEGFTYDETESLKYRLGNMTLLQSEIWELSLTAKNASIF